MKQQLKTDVVVVGSGPGGATVARDLALKGKDVIILERGGNNRPTGTVVAAAKYQGGLGALGKGMLITKDFLQVVRCLTLGGTSLMYLGCAWDPPLDMFAKYDVDLETELNEIKTELNVSPIPDDLIGPRAKALTASALDLGYDWKKIPKLVNWDNCRKNCYSCFYGCPHEAKFQARDWALEAAEKSAQLMTDTTCEEVIVENGQATGVRAIDKKGRELEISANSVVISAGGIGSPAILQKSGISDAGRTFFFDPFVCAFGYAEKKFSPPKEFPMVVGVHDPEGIMVTDMPLPFVININYAVMGLKMEKLLKSRSRLVGLLIKIRDDIEGVITVDEQIKCKPLTPGDQHKINKGKKIARDILKNMNAKDIWYSGDAAAHPGGTCRIGDTVDNNLETTFKNLYVVDASVIPEPWGLPPTLTVLSLARRLSKRLAA